MTQTSKQELAFEIALILYESEEAYPVDFEVAWQWLGYSNKGNAKRFLVKNFVENEDYRVIRIEKSASGGGLTHREDIYLTANCLKEMGMMSGTTKGKEVRNYFLQCEALAKQANKVIPQLQQQIQQLQQNFELLQSQIQKLLPLSADFVPPGWDVDVWASLPPQDKQHFKHLYRHYDFCPGSEVEVRALPAANRELQRAEIEHLINDVPEEEKQLIELAKRVSLSRFWTKWGES